MDTTSETPFDTPAYRIEQGRGVILALGALYDEEAQGFNLGARFIHMALGAADQLLEQADAALNAHMDQQRLAQKARQ